MGNEIADVAEQFKVNGNIPANLNSMFITLILKAADPTSFGDFRAISLCNLIYKITSKLIANRIKTTLEKHISREQYGFLRGRSIHEAMAVAQEALHSMHLERREAFIMKIDLMKAYDSLDWSYIRLVLLKIGLSIPIIRWIMTCITTVWYAVIINSLPTAFFDATRGFRQGCALSPMIFILVMDKFSKMLLLNKVDA